MTTTKQAEQPLADHYTLVKNAFVASDKFVVRGAGNCAIVMTEKMDGGFRLDLSKELVQHYEFNPRCALWLLTDGTEVYYYTYHDVLTILVGPGTLLGYYGQPVGICLWGHGRRILMDIDDWEDGHDGGDIDNDIPVGRPRHCWFCEVDDIEAEETPPKIIAKVEADICLQ